MFSFVLNHPSIKHLALCFLSFIISTTYVPISNSVILWVLRQLKYDRPIIKTIFIIYKGSLQKKKCNIFYIWEGVRTGTVVVCWSTHLSLPSNIINTDRILLGLLNLSDSNSQQKSFLSSGLGMKGVSLLGSGPQSLSCPRIFLFTPHHHWFMESSWFFTVQLFMCNPSLLPTSNNLVKRR